MSAASTRPLDIRLYLLQARAPSVVHEVRDGARPAEAVAGFVAAVRSVDDRSDHVADDRVRDDEEELRLGQEPRLEDAAAGFVRDAALSAVADRLDDRDADMPGCLLDRVDHRLDTLADDDRLHLLHR